MVRKNNMIGGNTMKFMLMSYESEEDFAARTDNERKEQYWTEWKAFFAAMKDAGILLYPGNILQSGSAAHTVRRIDGQAKGPYVDTKEQLSGYWIIDVSDLNQALEWANRAPATVNGAVEIRPIW
jgi:hypothetical protein